MNKYLYILFFVAVAMTSCSSDEVETSTVQREIQLAPAMSATRSSGNDRMIPGEDFYVWADMINDDGQTQVIEEYFNAWNLRIASDPAYFTNLGEQRLFPAENALNFYALHGNFADNTITANTSDFPKAANTDDSETYLAPLVHTTLATQTTDLQYLQSDLLYAVRTNVTATSDKVIMNFYHMLSKIEIALKASGKGIDNVELATASISIVNVEPTVTFLPAKVTQEQLADVDTRDNMLTLNTGVNTAKEFKIGDIPVSSDFSEVKACIVPPQTFKGNFIKLSYKSPGAETTKDYYYSIDAEDGLTLHSGKVYRFNLTVDHEGNIYNFEPTVTPWPSGEDVITHDIDVK